PPTRSPPACAGPPSRSPRTSAPPPRPSPPTTAPAATKKSRSDTREEWRRSTASGASSHGPDSDEVAKSSMPKRAEASCDQTALKGPPKFHGTSEDDLAYHPVPHERRDLHVRLRW